MPPRLPPITAAHCRMPSTSASRACASTQSSTVTSGKSAPHALPVAGFGESRSGRAEAAAEIVDADDEETVGVERLAGTDHVVPPADVVWFVRVIARDVMRRIERMAHEHRVRTARVERAVGFVREVVLRQGEAACEREWRIEARRAGDDRPHGAALLARAGIASGGRSEGGHRELNDRRERARRSSGRAGRPVSPGRRSCACASTSAVRAPTSLVSTRCLMLRSCAGCIDRLRKPRPSRSRVKCGSPAISPQTAIGTRTLSALVDRHRDELQHRGVQRVVQMRDGVVGAVHRQRVLDEVVGADRQEVELREERGDREHRRRDLDHPAHFDAPDRTECPARAATPWPARSCASVWSISPTEASIGTRIFTLP